MEVCRLWSMLHSTRHRNPSFSRSQYTQASDMVQLNQRIRATPIQDRDQISKQFKYTYCCDEIFLTFELLKHNMWDTLSENGSLRFIEWTTVSKHDSSPRILTDRDYEEITSPDILFARKINFPQSLKLVEHLDEYRNLGN